MSERTIDTYTAHVRRLAIHFGSNPEGLEDDQIRTYFEHLVKKTNHSRATLRQCLNALVSYYRDHLGREFTDVFGNLMPSKQKQQRRSLPKFYSRDEVRRLLEAASEPVERLFLMLVYGCGLRLFEAAGLRWRDLQLDRSRLFVCRGKGGKDRYLPIPLAVLDYLDSKWSGWRGKISGSNYIFSSPQKARTDQPVSVITAQGWYKKALKAAGLPRRGGIHSLRHSYATHQLELGVNIMQLQQLMGHGHVKTTMIYLHVSQEQVKLAGSPLDSLIISERRLWS